MSEITRAESWDAVRAAHCWNIPERYNLAWDMCEKWATSEPGRLALIDIANQAREHEAFFLITAPNDELARWMFSVMRKAVSGYRLRGNIELASRAGIRLRMPVTE